MREIRDAGQKQSPGYQFGPFSSRGKWPGLKVFPASTGRGIEPDKSIPERYGNWKTVYDRFLRWAGDGTLEAIVRHLQGELDVESHIDWGQFNVDSTIVQCARTAAGGSNDDRKGPN